MVSIIKADLKQSDEAILAHGCTWRNWSNTPGHVYVSGDIWIAQE
jgi:hypothetical protein